MKNDSQLEASALVMRFFAALDTRDHASVAAMMAPNGVWQRQGVPLHGPQAVLDALALRPANRVTSHVVTNLHIIPQETGGDALTVCYYLSAYESVIEADGSASAPRMLAILASTDELQRVNGEWRIARKTSRRHLPPQ